MIQLLIYICTSVNIMMDIFHFYSDMIWLWMSCLDVLRIQCPMLVYVCDTSPHYSIFLVSWCYKSRFCDFWRMEKKVHSRIFFIPAYMYVLTAFYIVLLIMITIHHISFEMNNHYVYQLRIQYMCLYLDLTSVVWYGILVTICEMCH